MRILAIETSCDDTGIAVLETPKKKWGDFGVLSNVVSSQIEIHRKYGGVYPMMAKRAHQENLVIVLEKALREAEMLIIKNSKLKIQNYNSKFKILKEILNREENLYKNLEKFLEKYQKPEVDAIAVTIGPGLEPCLWVGVNFAKALSYIWNVPIIPVNHVEAHMLANFVSEVKSEKLKVKSLFPAIALVVSGRHTQLILMKNFGKYKILGETRDDAAGECFDKTAKILGLGYPGGPAIAAIAAKLKIQNSKFKINLPRPMINTKDYDFSFSGLKTAVLYKVKSEKLLNSKGITGSEASGSKVKNEKYVQAIAAEIQQAIIDVLVKKTIKAVKEYRARTIILGGGVTANDELREQFKLKIKNLELKINFFVPIKKLCTDNALMTAVTGYYNKNKTKNWQKLEAKANLRI